MPAPARDLWADWIRLWRRERLRGPAAPCFDALLARYSEPARAYHNRTHLAKMLAQFDAVRAQAQRPEAVEWALWFHDAVYDARRGDNEAQSAAWAARELEAAGAKRDLAAAVVRLILATRHAAAPAEPDARMLCDLDLSILGAPPAEFAAYDRAIRIEYAWVDEAAYRRGRAGVLRAFLLRRPLFHFPDLRAKLEAQARINLQNALHGLEA